MRKERRRAPRTYSTVPLDLYDGEGRMIIGEARFVNVSMTGSMLESQQALQLRQPIRLQVQAPGKSSMVFAGRVVWRRRQAETYKYGVQFMPISAVMALARHGSPLASAR